MRKLKIQGDLIQRQLSNIAFPNERLIDQHKCFNQHDQPASICSEPNGTSNDELFLVIENQQDNDQDSGVYFSKALSLERNYLSPIPKPDYKFEMVHEDVKMKFSGMKEIIEQEYSFLSKINKYTFDHVEQLKSSIDCEPENITMTI